MNPCCVKKGERRGKGGRLQSFVCRKTELKNEMLNCRWEFLPYGTWSGTPPPPFSFQHQPGAEQKEINDLVIAAALRVLKLVIWSRSHCMPLCLGSQWLAWSTMASITTVGASAGRLASEQQRWKTSSNVITDGLSVPFELFTDWVNDYRQCVSWPGARNSYPPVRYYQRALPCLAGVLPKHLTEMPTQKEECSECACSFACSLSPGARATEWEY